MLKKSTADHISLQPAQTSKKKGIWRTIYYYLFQQLPGLRHFVVCLTECTSHAVAINMVFKEQLGNDNIVSSLMDV